MAVRTRDRAHAARVVAPGSCVQDGVAPIVFADGDGSTDDTRAVLADPAARHPQARTAVLRNAGRRGASAWRNLGVAALCPDRILFCGGGETLETGRAQTCLRMLSEQDAGAASGRRVDMPEGEAPEAASRRPGTGLRRSPPVRCWLCRVGNGAKSQGDKELPFTNTVITNPTSPTRDFALGSRCANESGHRGETDCQMKSPVDGCNILVTNDVHGLDLSPSRVRTGGQRGAPALERIRRPVHHKDRFHRKYRTRYAARAGGRVPKPVALAWFAAFAACRGFLRPPLYRVAMASLAVHRRPDARIAHQP